MIAIKPIAQAVSSTSPRANSLTAISEAMIEAASSSGSMKLYQCRSEIIGLGEPDETWGGLGMVIEAKAYADFPAKTGWRLKPRSPLPVAPRRSCLFGTRSYQTGNATLR